MSVGAILLCAGRGERLRAGIDKALAPLAGRPLFTWSLEAFERASAIEAVVVVGPVARLQAALAASGVAARKVVAWCEGGPTRQDSVRLGLSVLPKAHALVAVHDSARALVPTEVIQRCVADALDHGAAIAAVPLEDTVKRVRLGVIEDTVPRALLWRAQTPQVFRRDWLEAAHAAVPQARPGTRPVTATDDAALVEALGHGVRITEGDPINFKVTTAADLELAEAWIQARTGGGVT